MELKQFKTKCIRYISFKLNTVKPPHSAYCNILNIHLNNLKSILGRRKDSYKNYLKNILTNEMYDLYSLSLINFKTNC